MRAGLLLDLVPSWLISSTATAGIFPCTICGTVIGGNAGGMVGSYSITGIIGCVDGTGSGIWTSDIAWCLDNGYLVVFFYAYCSIPRNAVG